MENVASLIDGFGVALSAWNIAMMAFGVLLGVLVGVLPGLGAANGVALLLPLTFTMEPVPAIIFLTSVYWGAMFGGAITSILFNIPGEPSAVATTFDGHPMAKQGHATEALTYAFVSSGIGAMAGVLLITFTASSLASFALRFSPVEYFCVYIFVFASFVGLTSGNPLKAVISAALGFVLTTIGSDTVSGDLRLTFGFTELMRGISFLVAVIGMFGLAELIITVEEGLAMRGLPARLDLHRVISTVRRVPRYWGTYIRSAVIGCSMGILPGAGASSASLMSYGIARRVSANSGQFGSGRAEGIVAPETANNAAGICAMLPTLALAVPGSGTAAVLLGGLMMWGLTPGPMLFVTQREFVWDLIASMYLSNLMALVLVLTTAPFFAAILRIPFPVIAPVIVIVCLVGAYSVAGAAFDLWLLVIFAFVGYFFKKLDYPIAPLVLAMVLGSQAEDSFRQSMILSGGSLDIFWSSTISAGLLIAAGLVLFSGPFGRFVSTVIRKVARA